MLSLAAVADPAEAPTHMRFTPPPPLPPRARGPGEFDRPSRLPCLARRFDLVFVSCSDDGVFDDHVLQARHSKEAASLATWREDKAAAGLTCLADFHAWFYGHHLCYSVSRQHAFGARTITDERLLASY